MPHLPVATVLKFLLVALASGATGMVIGLHLEGAEPEQTTLTFDELADLTPQQVAAIALPEVSRRQVSEVRALGYAASGPHDGPPTELEGISFRMRASSAGWRGLCQADVVSIDMTPAGSGRFRPNGNVRVIQEYRFVDEAAAGGDWSESYGVELDRRCGEANDGRALFFSLGPDTSLRAVVDTLVALRALSGRDVRGGRITCSGDRSACEAPLSTLRSLQEPALSFANEPVCDPGQSCLDLVFEIGSASSSRLLTVSTTGAYRGVDQNGWGLLEISEVELRVGEELQPVVRSE